MNDNTFSVVLTDKSSNDAVAFPATTEKIGKFISGLLGQPQTISREVSGIFDIDLNWLNHVNALIEQRIKQQNDAARTSFSAKIFYDDDLIRTLESVEALQHFAETKKVRSVGVELHWTYVIKFPGKEIPEKQEITLGAYEKGSKYVTVGLQPIKVREATNLGRITYSIAHTERTWGDDIESILRQEIDLITKKTRWYESYFENSLMILGFICLLAGFLFPDYMNDRLQKEALSKIQPVMAQIADVNAFATLEVPRKLDLIAQFLNPANAVTKVGIKYRVVSALAGFGMMIMCVIWSDIRRASFVVLTKEAGNYRSAKLKKEQRRFLVIVLSFAASVAAGVVGNYAYLYLTT
jgi:hypothetical protein